MKDERPPMKSEEITTRTLWDLQYTLSESLWKDCRYPWEALPQIHRFLLALGPTLSPDVYQQVGEQIWIARSARIAPSAVILGPCIIGPDTEIRPCAFLRADVLIGRAAVIGNSTELKNAILFDRVEVPHYNYIGDSVLGYRAHFGAGALTSNVRGDRQNITVHCRPEIPTGLRKFGALVGDQAEIGCHAVLNPGSIIGRNAQVYPLTSVRGCLPADCICKQDGSRIRRLPPNFHPFNTGEGRSCVESSAIPENRKR